MKKIINKYSRYGLGAAALYGLGKTVPKLFAKAKPASKLAPITKGVAKSGSTIIPLQLADEALGIAYKIPILRKAINTSTTIQANLVDGMIVSTVGRIPGYDFIRENVNSVGNEGLKLIGLENLARMNKYHEEKTYEAAARRSAGHKSVAKKLKKIFKK